MLTMSYQTRHVRSKQHFRKGQRILVECLNHLGKIDRKVLSSWMRSLLQQYILFQQIHLETESEFPSLENPWKIQG